MYSMTTSSDSHGYRRRCDGSCDRGEEYEEQDRGLHAVVAHPSADLEAVEVGHHHVEQDHVGSFACHGVECVAAVGRHGHREAVVPQGGGEHGSQVVLVVDDQQLVGSHPTTFSPPVESSL
jgi:hypothetical protein